ncbi:MAG: nicotinate-nucleotide adenylyltransferase [Prevotella sp.]|nr:nicotinate-nucleotide adenylyltransferase [Prevotella sp.]
MLKRTGIYGGSFNPIHVAHVRLAKQLLEKANLDEVWFVVSPQNPFKQDQQLLDDDKRLQLVRLALKRHPRLVACDYEFHLPRPSYMHTTLTHLSADFPDREFVLLIGADNWERFDHWYRADDILRDYKLAIYPREGSPIAPTALPPNVQLVDTPLINLSSTEIRERIRQGRSIARLVPKAVADIISKEHLYAEHPKSQSPNP